MTDAALLTPQEQESLAARLLQAADLGEGIDPPSDTIEYTFADAYQVRRLLVDKHLARGARAVGHKIGFTAKAMQEMYGMTGPDFGQLLDFMVAPGDRPVEIGRLSDTRVEPELAFILAQPLQGPGIGIEEVLAATEHIVAAIEIIDSRVGAVRARAVDSIADNAGAGLFVLGSTPIAPRALDLATIAISMTVDGQHLAGLSGDVMDHPANAVAWLANKLVEIQGIGGSLEAGDIVLSGSVTRSVEVRPGSALRADFGPFGTIELGFA